MIVLDANVLIAYLDAEDAHHVRAEALLVAHVDEALAASPVTLAEVLVGPARTGRMGAASTAIEELGVRELALPSGAATVLASLRARTGLKLPDCCVLLAGQQGQAAVATFDQRLALAARELGRPVLPLT